MKCLYVLLNKPKLLPFIIVRSKISHDEIHNVHDDSENSWWIVPNVQEFMSVCPYWWYTNLWWAVVISQPNTHKLQTYLMCTRNKFLWHLILMDWPFRIQICTFIARWYLKYIWYEYGTNTSSSITWLYSFRYSYSHLQYSHVKE